MHHLAKREKNEKDICKKNMEDQHERVSGIHQIRRDLRAQTKKAGKVLTIAVNGEDIVLVPISCPIHLAPEKNSEKKEDQKKIVFRNR